MSKEKATTPTLDIFSMSTENLNEAFAEQTSGAKLPIYKTDPKKSNNKKFIAVVKFLPNINNPAVSLVQGVRYRVTDNPSGNSGTTMDSMKMKNEKCQVESYFWDLVKHFEETFSREDALKEASGYFKRQLQNMCLIQVLTDPQDESNEGKIFFYKAPKNIFDAIKGKIQPSEDDIKAGEVPTNIFDPINGLTAKISTVSEGQDWMWKSIIEWKGPKAIHIDGKPSKDQKAIVEFLKSFEYNLEDEFGFDESTIDLTECKRVFEAVTGTSSGEDEDTVTVTKPSVDTNTDALDDFEDDLPEFGA